MKKYNIQVGDLLYIPYTDSYVIVTRLSDNKSKPHRGIYRYETEERLIGTVAAIEQAIYSGEWIYYPVVE